MSTHSPEVVRAEVRRLLASLPIIRPVREGDRPLIAALMEELPLHARSSRFHATMSELPAVLLDRLARPASGDEAALLAAAKPHGREIAVGEARFARTQGEEGEFALVVHESWQRMGLGARLLRSLMRSAQESGVKTLHGDTFFDNVAMLALARRLGAEVRRHPIDQTLMRASFRLDRQLEWSTT